jgi:hypothetical protein
MERCLAATAVAVLSLLAACAEPPAPASGHGAAPVSAPVALAPVVARTPAPAKPDSNAILAERVKRALEGESKVHAAAIDVTAAGGGVVTLWGTADNDDERLRAARAAYRVNGVNTVHNRLAIVKGS